MFIFSLTWSTYSNVFLIGLQSSLLLKLSLFFVSHSYFGSMGGMVNNLPDIIL